MEYEELDNWAGLVFFIALPFLIAYYLWDRLCQSIKGKVKEDEN
jgi:hypothetical protein